MVAFSSQLGYTGFGAGDGIGSTAMRRVHFMHQNQRVSQGEQVATIESVTYPGWRLVVL
ncbi:hypothetical protein DBB_38070 [Desulfoluna spongiiphila]|nr:hypothetical protein DBB_38070 [Desulfoluna spongiiphila]